MDYFLMVLILVLFAAIALLVAYAISTIVSRQLEKKRLKVNIENVRSNERYHIIVALRLLRLDNIDSVEYCRAINDAIRIIQEGRTIRVIQEGRE